MASGAQNQTNIVFNSFLSFDKKQITVEDIYKNSTFRGYVVAPLSANRCAYVYEDEFEISWGTREQQWQVIDQVCAHLHFGGKKNPRLNRGALIKNH